MPRGFRRYLAAAVCPLLVSAGAATTLSPAAAEPAGTGDTRQAQFRQVTLAKGAAETGEPMSLAVLPDRSVLPHRGRHRLRRRGQPLPLDR